MKSMELTEKALFNEISQLIEQSKLQLVAQANSTITMLFWYIGNRINQSILQNKMQAIIRLFTIVSRIQSGEQ
jgi:predicted membrane chloride channel (bestrophin family)